MLFSTTWIGSRCASASPSPSPNPHPDPNPTHHVDRIALRRDQGSDAGGALAAARVTHQPLPAVRDQRGLARARVVDVLTKKDLVDLRPEGGAVAVLVACSGDVRVTTDRLV